MKKKSGSTTRLGQKVYVYANPVRYWMSDNKLIKTVLDATSLTGLAAGIGWVAGKKTVKENFIADPSSNAMNYVKFTVVMAPAVALKEYLEYRVSSPKRLMYI